MVKKYWVPSIEKVNDVMTIIAKEPKKLKLIDIAKKTNNNKSSIFSILNTLNSLGWIYKESDGSYSLGSKLGFFSAMYIKQYDLTEYFNRETEKVKEKINETIQLSIREGKDIVYIGKKESSQRVRIVSEPGMRLPAHATAMGKVLLSPLSKDSLTNMYKNETFEKLTNKTIENLNQLINQINMFKQNGYVVEHEEAIRGFTCIAAPILNEKNKLIAAISFTMITESWEKKKEFFIEEILTLAEKISIS